MTFWRGGTRDPDAGDELFATRREEGRDLDEALELAGAEIDHSDLRPRLDVGADLAVAVDRDIGLLAVGRQHDLVRKIRQLDLVDQFEALGVVAEADTNRS